MPFKSQAQRRKFAELLVEGKISPETFGEWNRETGDRKLPERAGGGEKRKHVGGNKEGRHGQNAAQSFAQNDKASGEEALGFPQRLHTEFRFDRRAALESSVTALRTNTIAFHEEQTHDRRSLNGQHCWISAPAQRPLNGSAAIHYCDYQGSESTRARPVIARTFANII